MGLEEAYKILVASSLMVSAISLWSISYSLVKGGNLLENFYQEIKALREDLKKNKGLEDKTEEPQ